MDEVQNSEIPLLEWYDNDSKAEHFSLVQSRKKEEIPARKFI
jgi:hypothetical protein